MGSAWAAGKVLTIATPDGGQAMFAHTDAEHRIHLVFNGGDGPLYAKSSDGGKSFSKSIPILDRASRKPGLVFTIWDMAVGPAGEVHVALGTNAWKLKLPKDEWGFLYARLEPEAASFSAVRNINRKPSEGFSLAADGNGRVTACWLADKLYANISRDHGQTFEPTVEFGDGYDPCNCCTTSVTYGTDGRLAILYREETDNERDMYLILWDQKTDKKTRTRVSTTLWKLDACPMTYYAVTATEEGYTIAWPTEGKIYFAHLDHDGKLIAPAEIKTAGSTGMRTGMFVLNGLHGDTLVGWKKDGQLGWQTFDRRSRETGTANLSSPGSGAAGIVDKNGDFLLFR